MPPSPRVGFIEIRSHALLIANNGHCTDRKGGAASAIVWASQEGARLYDPATGAEDPNTGYPNECLNSAEFPCAESHTLLLRSLG